MINNLNADQFASQHPHLNHYRDGGMGGVGEDHSVVGYVPTEHLLGMPGNSTDRDRVNHYRAAIQSGEGFKDPVMVLFDPKNKLAYVGEGNHRVKAAAEEGLSHVPTRVVRTQVHPDDNRGEGGHPKPMDPGRSPWAKENVHEDNYWPSDIHPSHLFPGTR